MDALHDLAPNRPPPPPPIKTRLNGLNAGGWSSVSHYVSIADQGSPRDSADGLLSPGSSCRSALSPAVLYSPFAASFGGGGVQDRASPREPPSLSAADLNYSDEKPFVPSTKTPQSRSPSPPVVARPVVSRSTSLRPSQIVKMANKPYKDEQEPDVLATTINPYGDDEEDEEEENDDEDDDIPELPPLIIITGATTGLGLAFFEHFSTPPPEEPASSSASIISSATTATTAAKVNVPYDVIGIDKVPWRLPGQGFQWQTKVGTRGQFVQVDTTATAKRLDAWADKWLYASVPVATTALPSSSKATTTTRGVNGGTTTIKNKTKRYPRPISLVIHCAEARGLVPEIEQQQFQQLQKLQQQQHQQSKRKSTTKTPQPPAISLSPAAAETLDVMTADTMRRTYDANVVGTLQLAQTVIPHMQLHAQFSQARGQDLLVDATEAGLLDSTALPSEPPPRLVMLGAGGGSGSGGRGGSGFGAAGTKEAGAEAENGEKRSGTSKMGSIKGNVFGGGYAYRASKAALNAVIKSLSVDIPEVCFATVETGLADLNIKARDEDKIGEVVQQLLPLIGKLGTGDLASGRFVDRYGNTIDW
ncbi:hypothetical protein BD289DRAFT_479394 [Coniella lustricola]|uniref:Uncharacterized protein n=1 Tax=Coniella lustricola TaxID=2025994 RepID=A0A2T3AJL4_9PEZI|nr:hypothetical protein BD289DRAFT_479394 [Coniella lustricola]